MEKIWDTCTSTRELAEGPRAHFVEHAEWYLGSLASNNLEVVLTPADQDHPHTWGEGHMLRLVVGRNPKWYREAYTLEGARRDRLIRAFWRIIESKDLNYLDPRVIDRHDCLARRLICNRLVDGWVDTEDPSSPPLEFSGADCFRASLGLAPLNPIDACVTYSIGY